MTKSYKQVTAVKDDKLDINQLEHYLLCIQIGNRDIQIMVADSKSHRCLLLEDYILAEFRSVSEKLAIIKDIFDNHHLLMARFWKNVLLCFKSNKFSIVPLEYFSKELARDYLKLNCSIHQETEKVGYYKIGKLDAANIFAFEKDVLNWIRELYGKESVRVTHQSGMLINALLEKNRAEKQQKLSVVIDRFIMHIVVQKSTELIFYNQFVINSFDDYVKYISFCLKEFGLSKSTPLSIYGFIKEKGNYWNAIKKQFPNIQSGSRINFMQFSYLFDEVAEHKYVDVFGIYLNN